MPPPRPSQWRARWQPPLVAEEAVRRVLAVASLKRRVSAARRMCALPSRGNAVNGEFHTFARTLCLAVVLRAVFSHNVFTLRNNVRGSGDERARQK
eukprot:2605106-Prymnesium_polylepis.2